MKMIQVCIAWWLGQAQGGAVLKQNWQCQSQLKPRQRCANAKVDAAPKGSIHLSVAPWVEHVGIGPDCGVTIGRSSVVVVAVG